MKTIDEREMQNKQTNKQKKRTKKNKQKQNRARGTEAIVKG